MILNHIYNVLDTLLIIFILGTIIRAPKGGAGGAGRNMAVEKKKFDVVTNVTVKFQDVAGLH